jgi:hypothetical protein
MFAQDEKSGPLKSREENAIIWLFRSLSKEDIELLGGVTLQHIRFILGAPRKFRPGRSASNSQKRLAEDIQIYRQFKAMDNLPFHSLESFGKQVRKHAIRVIWLCMKGPENSSSDRPLPPDWFDSRLQTGMHQFEKYVHMHIITTALRHRDVWTRKDCEAFGRKKNISQVIRRHCTKLVDLGILSSEDSLERKKRKLSRSSKEDTESWSRKRRLDVRYFPGEKLWTDPYRLQKLKREVGSTDIDDIHGEGPIFLFGVSHIPPSLRSSLPSQMISDLNDHVRQLCSNWLRDSKNQVIETVARAKKKRDDYWEKCRAEARAAPPKSEQIEFIESLDPESATLFQGLVAHEFRGITKEIEQLWDSTGKEIEKVIPRLPLAVIDLSSLAREVIELTSDQNC